MTSQAWRAGRRQASRLTNLTLFTNPAAAALSCPRRANFFFLSPGIGASPSATRRSLITSDLNPGRSLGGATAAVRGKCRDGWGAPAPGHVVRGRACAGSNIDWIAFGYSCSSAMGSMDATSSTTTNGVADAGVESVTKPRRFAVLTTGHAAEYCEERYGGYGAMFITMLSDPGEQWDEYFVVEGQFPRQEQLHEYDGFVVTGSRHDAHADEAWIVKLCSILKQLHKMKKKSLCVCFGHQVLSRALGGKTGRASVGWEVGLRDICLTDAFFSKSYAAGMPPKLKVLEVHRDQVSEIPQGAELLAFSERTGVEMFALGEHALAIQGHPEFFDDVVVDLLEGRLAPMMTEEEVKLSKESLSKARADQKAWQQLCKDFLKGSKAL